MTRTLHDSTTPSAAFRGASWLGFGLGAISFIWGLFRSEMALNERGYYLTLLLYGLFAVASLQKSVRDREEDIPVTPIYFGMCWVSVGAVGVLMAVGLWNASLLGSEKGFYAMSFCLALFGALTVQKNVRDMARSEGGINQRMFSPGASSEVRRSDDE